MSPYDPNIHHRRSVRLQDYDYASAGFYFVTICTQNRECLFGNIENNDMVLNNAGRMIERWYHKTQDKFPDIICHEMVVMPNHFHCIWENIGPDGASGVGANPCVRPPKQNNNIFPEGGHTGPPLRMDNTDWGIHAGSPLSMVVGWFKTMSTNEYIRGVKQSGWPPFDRKLWQRNYYEHIIRDDISLQNIAYYISNNPTHWQEDDFYQSPKTI